jgi:beta-hydroxylase
MIRSSMEKIIARSFPRGDPAFFDVHAFKWVPSIEAQWECIHQELMGVLGDRESIPAFQEVSADQSALTQHDHWKTFFLYAYGHRIHHNCLRCPATARLLHAIPGMKTAMFSILAPGKHIPEHRGPYKGVLRYHLGLIIPEPHETCGIRVKQEIRSWAPGHSLIFDDSHPHEAWNRSLSERVVLFVDFARPLPFPLSLLNRVIIARIARTPFVTTAVDRLRNPQLIAAERRQAPPLQ